MGALSTLVEAHPFSFTGFNLGIGVDFGEVQEEDRRQLVAARKGKQAPEPAKVGVGREGGGRAAGKIWEMIRWVALLSLRASRAPSFSEVEDHAEMARTFVDLG